jgi:hypothetical protein
MNKLIYAIHVLIHNYEQRLIPNRIYQTEKVFLQMLDVHPMCIYNSGLN